MNIEVAVVADIVSIQRLQQFIEAHVTAITQKTLGHGCDHPVCTKKTSRPEVVIAIVAILVDARSSKTSKNLPAKGT